MPPKLQKRKLDSPADTGGKSKRSSDIVCILHARDIQHGDFTPLSIVRGTPEEKLQQLTDIRERRLQQDEDSPYRYEDICSQIPNNLDGIDVEVTGFHRGCYQNFTKNLDRLKNNNQEEPKPIHRSPRKLSGTFGVEKFPLTCIFCEKLECKLKRKTERCTTFAVYKDKNSLLEPTWKQREPNPRANDTDEDRREASREMAFTVVVDYIQEHVIREKEVVELSALRSIYVSDLEKAGFPNPQYRGEKLKARLEHHVVGESINFTKVNLGDRGCICYNLVYSADKSVADAIAHGYKLGSVDKYKDVALYLRTLIRQAFMQSHPLPWPPTADDLDINVANEVLPSELTNFLNFVLSGSSEPECEKTTRIVSSICQDICRATTNGEWKLPKHILLCTTIRHLYRSKQLTTIISRLGHCETYDFGLELETAVAKALDERIYSSSLLNDRSLKPWRQTKASSSLAHKERSFSTESKAILPLCFLKSQFLEEPVDLDELMTYSLTPVPHSLGTPDGFLNKTNKATILHFLTDDYDGDALYPSEKCLYIQDGNALFHALTQLPPTFGEICLQMLDQMVAKKDFIFSTDSYHENSIKSQERIRRGSSPKYIVDGPATRKPAEFKLFLSNDANKVQLYRLLLRVWGSSVAASRLEKCDRGILVVEGKAYQCELLNGDVTTHELHELTSNQEETDTRVILYLKYAVRMGYESAVVRTPDTDILCILMHYAPSLDVNIYLDIGTGKNRKLINVRGGEYCTALLGLYVFTGEDATSAFKGKGKVGPLKKLQKHQKYQRSFSKLGMEWTLDGETMNELGAFTCLMYGYPREISVNMVRSIILGKMIGGNERLTIKSKVELSRLPPCRDNLVPHMQRVNHRVASYKRADQAVFWRPYPFEPGQGRERNDDGLLEPVWSCGPVLPTSLIDKVESTVDEEEDDEEDSPIDFDEAFSDEEE
ncbi:predicted protein [Nematostella vectensis]|uniref:Uncharacterized protein n=1 Tax=Nematostella vectensis TaxID=45351 RepID=A7SWG7_NEMVE|nr:predicted protein [Nematostella vectensis]|eukprot:XP_001624051.1 predicted protein [Nematostella vectensis]